MVSRNLTAIIGLSLLLFARSASAEVHTYSFKGDFRGLNLIHDIPPSQLYETLRESLGLNLVVRFSTDTVHGSLTARLSGDEFQVKILLFDTAQDGVTSVDLDQYGRHKDRLLRGKRQKIWKVVHPRKEDESFRAEIESAIKIYLTTRGMEEI